MHGVFITGTDTGVGKTRVGAALAHLLTGRGLRVRPRKPVESGCPAGPGGPLPQDAAVLREAAGCAEPLQHICPCRLQVPLSPERAAELGGMDLDVGRLHAACLAGIGSGDFLLVQGADGFYSPLARGAFNADLVGGLGMPRRSASGWSCWRRRARALPEDVTWRGLTDDVRDQARQLFHSLRQTDHLGLQVLVAVVPPDVGFGHAVRDRLRRAAGVGDGAASSENASDIGSVATAPAGAQRNAPEHWLGGKT